MTASLHLLDSQTLIVVDVETTGLSARYGDRVCEVGLVRAQGDLVLDTYQSLVNPLRPISPGASLVNGLTDEDVRDASPFAEIAEDVLDWIDGALLLCHNAPFDLGFLEAEFSSLGRSWGPAGVIDTLDIARRFFSFPSNSLPAVAAHLGVATPHAHRALGDALTTLQVFRHFYRHLVDREALQDEQLVGYYRPAAFPMVEAVLPPEIQEALAENKPIILTYVDAKGEETIRMITPLRVWAADGYVYLKAYCHLRSAERHFRLDRIASIGELELP